MASRRHASRKVLVVDDSQIACDFARDVLEQAGYVVLAMNSHFGFIKMLREKKPDLVLVDVAMPALNGPKLVELARARRVVECPIVLYSDRDDSELSRLVRACGADGYIRKTSEPAELEGAVARSMSIRATP